MKSYLLFTVRDVEFKVSFKLLSHNMDLYLIMVAWLELLNRNPVCLAYMRVSQQSPYLAP